MSDKKKELKVKTYDEGVDKGVINTIIFTYVIVSIASILTLFGGYNDLEMKLNTINRDMESNYDGDYGRSNRNLERRIEELYKNKR